MITSTAFSVEEVYETQLQIAFGVTRLITTIVMHILIMPDFSQSFEMMKYALNHPWKFRDFKLAFLTGLLQWTISVVIELTNVYVLMTNSSTQFDVIANFIIMLVVAEFDSYFEAIRSVDPRSELMQNERYASIL